MKHRLLIPLLAALFMLPSTVLSQNGTVTVANGTVTNGKVPVEGFNCDNYLRCQMLYRASDFTGGAVGTSLMPHGSVHASIQQMTFYASSPAQGSWGNAQFQIKVMEISATTLGSSYNAMSSATVVYNDTLDGQDSMMTIVFDTPYQYNGGNLLVEISSTQKGNWKSITWKGISRSGASVQGYSSSSPSACTATQCDFLPKTTFTFTNGSSTTVADDIMIGNAADTTVSYAYPVNNFYRYSLSETIIDASEIGGAMSIQSIAYRYAVTDRNYKKCKVTIWLQPTTKTQFSSSNDIEPLSSSAVKVYEGPLTCGSGWNEFVFATPYEYDGRGNLMVIVDDNSNNYNGSSYNFNVSSCSGDKTLAWYSDTYNPATDGSTFSGIKNKYDKRVQMRLKGARESEVCLSTIDFHDGTQNGNQWMGTGYSTGWITSGVSQHSQNFSFAYWRRVRDTSNASLEALATICSRLENQYYGGMDNFKSYLCTYASSLQSPDNGFMIIIPYEQATMGSGVFNAYIDLGTVDVSYADVVDVSFYQYYRKYYDKCYIDWRTSSSSEWQSMEINVTGEDVNVSGTLRGRVVATLPLEALQTGSLQVRLRYYSDGTRGNSYGYFWMVDDFSIVDAEGNRLQQRGEEYVFGNYGILPQSLQVKPAWYAKVRNNGAIAQDNLTAGIYHYTGSQTPTLLGAYNNGSAAPTTEKELVYDPDGWLNLSELDTRGWDYGRQPACGNGSPLPTADPGDHFIFAKVTSDQKTFLYDTMYYNVSTADPDDGTYLWARDNGVLSYSPWNYVVEGWVYVNSNYYYTDDPEEVNFNRPGYEITLRYSTSDAVPQNWAILGVEFVASPVPDYNGLGATIKPVLSWDSISDDGTSYYSRNLPTGVDSYQITENDINTPDVIGRDANGYLELGQYNTIRILFPTQPRLQPHTSYRIGYSMVTEGDFLLARSFDYYRLASPTRPDYDTIIYYKNDPATAKYAHIFEPNRYDVYFYDTTRTSGRQGSWFNEPTLPMIRLLVGPRTVGIESAENSLSVALQPNPATGWVTVGVAGATGKVDCTITDINGRQVYNTQGIMQSGNQSFRINVASFPAGVYIVRIRTADGLENIQKLIVK